MIHKEKTKKKEAYAIASMATAMILSFVIIAASNTSTAYSQTTAGNNGTNSNATATNSNATATNLIIAPANPSST